jgi:capsule polysaccharide export protein KpsE/RkpR
MNSKVLNKKDLGDTIQTTIQLSNADKSFLTTEEIKQIADRFTSATSKCLIRGLNIERWMTLKGMNDDFDDEAFDDYYRNKVKEADVDKFTTFAQVQITVFKKK